MPKSEGNVGVREGHRCGASAGVAWCGVIGGAAPVRLDLRQREVEERGACSLEGWAGFIDVAHWAAGCSATLSLAKIERMPRTSGLNKGMGKGTIVTKTS